MTSNEIREEFEKERKCALTIAKLVAKYNPERELDVLVKVSQIYWRLAIKAILRPTDKPMFLEEAWKQSMTEIGGYEV